MKTRVWYLVRHGETEWNAERRMQGQLDSKLSEKGRAHAAQTGALLAKLGVDHIFASPLGRVRETLSFIAPHVPHAPVFDDRLMEWASGSWSGRLYGDIAREEPEAFAAWEADRYNVRAPGGENFVDLEKRARSFYDHHHTVPHERIAIVAHGFFNRAMAGVLLGLPPSKVMQIRQLNDALIRVRFLDKRAVVDHFLAGEGPHKGLPGYAPAGHVA